MSRYHCYSCDKEDDIASRLNECYELGHEVLKVLDENDYDINQKNDTINKEPKAYRNDNWDLVASEIQSDNNFLTLRENKDIWCYSKDEGIYK